MEVQIHTLKNGIRIVHQQFNGSPISHCAFFINAGSRDEAPGTEGIAHFIEHLLFKGTRRRKAIHIIKRMEVVGAELNAYTTKEETCVHASFLNEHFERAVELMADILFNSVYPEKEIKNEKDVVIDEIRSYRDNHIEQIHDDFEGIVFSGHPLGNLILGTEESVSGFQREDIFKYLSGNYYTDEMVLSVGGSLPFEKVVRIVEKYFSDISAKTRRPPRRKFSRYKASELEFYKHSSQTHIITGNIAFSYMHKLRYPLYLLNNIVAGPGMNSRLNLSLREKYGLAYHIESNYSNFSDTGLFSIYMGTDPSSYERVRRLLDKELQIIKTKKLGTVTLRQFKQQLLGHIAISKDQNVNLTVDAGKHILYRGRIFTVEEIFKNVEAISAEDILEVANRIFDQKSMSTLVFKPYYS